MKLIWDFKTLSSCSGQLCIHMTNYFTSKLSFALVSVVPRDVVWGGHWALCRSVFAVTTSLQQQRELRAQPRQCLPLPAHETELWDRQRKAQCHIKLWCLIQIFLHKEENHDKPTPVSFLPICRILPVWRCRSPCLCLHSWEPHRPSTKSICGALWKLFSRMLRMTWSWEIPPSLSRYQTLGAVLVAKRFYVGILLGMTTQQPPLLCPLTL